MCEKNVESFCLPEVSWMFSPTHLNRFTVAVRRTAACSRHSDHAAASFARWVGSWRTWWTYCVGIQQAWPWHWRNARRARSLQPPLCSRTWDGNRWLCKYEGTFRFHPPQMLCDVYVCLCQDCACVYMDPWENSKPLHTDRYPARGWK